MHYYCNICNTEIKPSNLTITAAAAAATTTTTTTTANNNNYNTVIIVAVSNNKCHYHHHHYYLFPPLLGEKVELMEYENTAAGLVQSNTDRFQEDAEELERHLLELSSHDISCWC